jgi:hypothetical protein
VTGRVVLTNAANCTFGGSVRYTLDGAISTVTDATMAESKETVEGVGIFAGGAFIFNMVKIK